MDRKHIIILGVLITISGTLSQQTSEDNPRLNAWLRDCQVKSGASEQDYQTIKMRKMPNSPEGVCMVECIFSKLHIIENGKFNKKGFVIAFSPLIMGDIRKLKNLKNISEACDQEIDQITFDEQCGITKNILECIGRHRSSFSINKKN